MKKRELLGRIEWLEKRVSDLEARPLVTYPQPYWVPYTSPTPWIQPTIIGDPMPGDRIIVTCGVN